MSEIRTTSELDALPVGSVVLFPMPLQTKPVPFERRERGWQQPGSASVYETALMASRYLPAVVVHRPDAPAPSAEDDGHGRGEPIYDDRQRYAETIARHVGWQPGVYEAAERILVLAARQPAPVDAETVKRGVLAARWPNGDLLSGVTSRTADLIAESVVREVSRG